MRYNPRPPTGGTEGRRPHGALPAQNTLGIIMHNHTGSDAVPPLPQNHTTLSKILHHDAIAAVLLLLAALSAFVIANLPLRVGEQTVGDWYTWLWHQPVGLAIFHHEVSKPLHLWINDGLMAIFFFLVGLEIKRELLVGELASFRKAMLPIAAAIGGMTAPALVYAAINAGRDSLHGWGIPMATDIAFAVGVLGILGRRIPRSIAVFLIALAIVDDLGAVLVIALFYTEKLHVAVLVTGLALVGISAVLGRIGVRSTGVYVVLGGLIWLAFLESGIHATVAGVLFAFTIPASPRRDPDTFSERVKELLQHFDRPRASEDRRDTDSRHRAVVRAIEVECVHVEAPLLRIEHTLHPYSAMLIMPIFAFANAGVQIGAEASTLLVTPVTLGVVLGMLVGKQAGIMAACWAAVRFGLAELPQGMTWRLLYGLSWLAGIGFTMSLFIGQLAFAPHGTHELDPAAAAHLAEAKIGILIGSIVAGTVGTFFLIAATKPSQAPA